MSIVLLLVSGSYSDYGVHAAFTSEGSANAARDHLNAIGGEFSVESIMLDPALDSLPQLPSWTVRQYFVDPNDRQKMPYIPDGDFEVWRNTMYAIEERVYDNPCTVRRHPLLIYDPDKARSWRYDVCVLAEDAVTATKAGLEYIRAFRATGCQA